ncbi:hypothetical protein [Chelativorans sp. Marseille-P2723]|uniref:hypothetical protein n=1 Tax=Chelativorans sp. Marseille-P2723 TaxID=2709133 RepID=UPI00156D6A34|nr:hypothetical protein [Chelativorans sp. Marseille-P2723]
MSIARHALISGALAGAASLAAVMIAARCEGRSALQPLNATSHWLHGDKAGSVRRADISHTGVGLLTHAASAMFWAVPFAVWQAGRKRTFLEVVGDAALVSGVAALVDYGMIHRRLTPGWELAVSKQAVASAFIAMAAGLAAGSLLNQRKT